MKIYLAGPDVFLPDAVEIGRRLAREHPVDGDLVIPVPESGTPAAVGFAQE